MIVQPELRYRKPNRLRNFDYSRAGFYFITIGSSKYECTFGRVENAISYPSKLGLIIHECWREIPQHFSTVHTDFFVLMPNHLHCIVEITQSGKTTLPTIVNSFKSAVTRIARVKGIQDNRDVWHRSFQDKVIRDETALNAYRQYIADNPIQWQVDELNPSRF